MPFCGSIPDKPSPKLTRVSSGEPPRLTATAEEGLLRLAMDIKNHQAGCCVLLVDDDNNDSLLIQQALRVLDEKIIVHRVSDGMEALDYLNGKGDFSDQSRYPFPDVVLLDLCLPGFSGMEVLGHIRRSPLLDGATVITLTGSDSERDSRQALTLGADAYILKPKGKATFVEVVRDLRSSGLI